VHALRGLNAHLTPLLKPFFRQRCRHPSAFRCTATAASMASTKFGKTITQQARGTQSATVFIMHGLGDSGEGLSHIGPALSIPWAKFVYPTAPVRESSSSSSLFNGTVYMALCIRHLAMECGVIDTYI